MIPVGLLTFYNLSIASSIRTRVSRIFLLENNYKFDRIIIENYSGKLKLVSVKNFNAAKFDEESSILKV